MDSKQIQYILKVAECQNITRAAEQLGYTQSGLSYVIKTLENEINDELSRKEDF